MRIMCVSIRSPENSGHVVFLRWIQVPPLVYTNWLDFTPIMADRWLNL
jgi:hypothetical protein